ncbi:MAG: hypothetical protein FJ189_09380 [Gammaproteobacteria bacterium]|nr:hypothetical protein [Gammaproteobacteria bacterium]
MEILTQIGKAIVAVVVLILGAGCAYGCCRGSLGIVLRELGQPRESRRYIVFAFVSAGLGSSLAVVILAGVLWAAGWSVALEPMMQFGSRVGSISGAVAFISVGLVAASWLPWLLRDVYRWITARNRRSWTRILSGVGLWAWSILGTIFGVSATSLIAANIADWQQIAQWSGPVASWTLWPAMLGLPAFLFFFLRFGTEE